MLLLLDEQRLVSEMEMALIVSVSSAATTFQGNYSSIALFAQK